jgi:hypothetical protein
MGEKIYEENKILNLKASMSSGEKEKKNSYIALPLLRGLPTSLLDHTLHAWHNMTVACWTAKQMGRSMNGWTGRKKENRGVR